MSCSRTTTQWRLWGSNPWPLGLESSTLPLSHCAPTGTLAKSADPDEMPHNAPFHQGLHCLLNNSVNAILWVHHSLYILFNYYVTVYPRPQLVPISLSFTRDQTLHTMPSWLFCRLHFIGNSIGLWNNETVSIRY